jgi:DNA-binding beta-propeller fold protein YncE
VARCGAATALDGASRIVITRDGKNVYVAAAGDGVVVAFARDARTGLLRAIGCIGGDNRSPNPNCAAGRALTTPQTVALAPDDRFLYVTTGNGIVTLMRDPRTGGLSEAFGSGACIVWNEQFDGDCRPGSGLHNAFGLAVAADGRAVYSASFTSNAVTMYDRDPRTGVLSQTFRCVSDDGKPPCARARGLEHAGWTTISSDGRFVYVNAPYANALSTWARKLPAIAPRPVGTKPRVRRGKVRLNLSCPVSSIAGCYGTFTLSTSKGRSAIVAYDIAAGKRKTIALRVPKGAHGRARLVVTAREPTGGRAAKRYRLTLR